MASEDAATWLMENYPVDAHNYGDAIALIPHRSWGRSDQIRLARHYLRKLPFASSRVYEAFASFMSLDLFVKIIKEYWPHDEADVSLLIYHLRPVLNKFARTDSDRAVVLSLVSRKEAE